RLVRPRVDAEQYLALLDRRAFAEIDLDYLTVDPRFQRDRRIRLDVADRPQLDRHGFLRYERHGDRHGRRPLGAFATFPGPAVGAEVGRDPPGNQRDHDGARDQVAAAGGSHGIRISHLWGGTIVIPESAPGQTTA